jgi:hypothetical protein
MITSMMKTLKTKYGSSWLDFFNLEDFINLLDDDPYLYSLEGSDDVPVGTEYPSSTDYLDQ